MIEKLYDDAQKHIILIVDDSDDTIDLASSILEEYNYDVIVAKTGVEAIKKAIAEDIDLILLDIYMPDLDGFEICKRLKLSEATKYIPIIFLTAKDDSENVVKGLQIGGQDYITKPFNINELLVRVKNQIKLQNTINELKSVNKRLNETIELLAAKTEDNRRIEDKRKESEERYRILFQASPDAIIVHDGVKLLFLNEKASKLLGVTGEDLLYVLKLEEILHRDHFQQFKEDCKDLLEAKKNIPIKEMKIRTARGRIIDVEILSNHFIYEEQSLILTIIRNITDRKRIERLREDVERIIRHDLKSPLSCIIGFSEMLIKKADGTDKVVEYSNLIKESGNKMLNIIESSLDFHKMETGSYEIKKEEYDLIQLFEQMNKDYSHIKEQKNLQIEYFLNGEILDWENSLGIMGEQFHIRNLFDNIMKNAIDASPENSKITVSIKDTKTDEITVDIHNMGAIPEKIRDRFFEKYVTHGKVKGTGIGTYSALLIAKAHKGNIDFTTSEEEGTTLSVTLPKNPN